MPVTKDLLVFLPELAHLSIFVLRYTNLLIIIIIIIIITTRPHRLHAVHDMR